MYKLNYFPIELTERKQKCQLEIHNLAMRPQLGSLCGVVPQKIENLGH